MPPTSRIAPEQDPALLPELDLAFLIDLDPQRLQACAAAGDLVDPERGEATWCELLSRWLAALASELPQPLRAGGYSLGLSLVDDDRIAGLNSAWRQQAGPTDVLAFSAQEAAPPLSGIAAVTAAIPHPIELGDIIISLETARRQARDGGQSLERELLFLASHGLLHLLGWDHPDEESLIAMLERQDRLLALIPPEPAPAG